MSEKRNKSQAEKAAATKKNQSKSNKSAANKENKEIKENKADKDSNVSVNTTADETKIPVRLITSIVFLGLFVLFLVIFFKPEGALIKFFANFINGLIGKTGFIVSIPGFLYLFIIHAFSGERPVKMRSICVGSFILLCGCIAHLSLMPQELPSLLSGLYRGGIVGTTGGVICGCLTMMVHWLCGTVISYILLILAAVLALLGGMQITVMSIIRAIQERPRPNWEEEPVERQDPAAIVVNHIANKRIKHMEHKREQRLQQELEAEAQPLYTEYKKTESSVVEDIFRQIDADTELPVAAAAEYVQAREKEEPGMLKLEVQKESVSSMPPFDKNAPLPEKPAPVVQKVKPEKVTGKDAQTSAQEVTKEIQNAQKNLKPEYCFPPIDLLKLPSSGAADGTMEMRENSRRLNETLASFRIEAHIVNVTRGPSVTRYEVELEKGVKLSKLTSAADDIALSLGATGVRIAAIPGKISVVGIEVPNRAVTMVSLREVIDSQEFAKAKSKSSFSVGKDIGGNCIVGNIARLPHMLIAGTTGSGKSVCMNSIIISLLYKASPDDVKLIMVDPKMVELGIYNGIPHLLIPVVTDPKKAAGSLQWAVSEMMRRYKAMSDAGVRDLESYNSIMESQEMEGTKLPQVVVIIDELADLMLVAAKEVEESICRIAQMGRAAGIHLIIATQRPSADVITGLMKANIPSRIAFAVASAMESRIILDTQGAEKLVGKGDMLYAPIGNGKPKRVQGCFVSDPEVEAVANYVKTNFATSYDQEVMEEIERKAVQTGNKSTASDPEPTADELEGDEMLPAAVDVILETGQASVSMLQRRLKLGYARAARIVDEMEEKGIVGPVQGSKPRDILVTKEQWAAMRSGGSAQLGFDDMEAYDDAEDTAVPEDF